MDPVKVGALVIGLVLVLCYFGFTKDNPFSRGFRFKAVFPSANSITPKSPVRIAGVNIGRSSRSTARTAPTTRW